MFDKVLNTPLNIDKNKNRSSHLRCSVKKGVLKNFSNFTRKHLCWRLFLIKLQVFRPATLLKEKFSRGVLLRNLRNLTYFEEHLRTTASARMGETQYLILTFTIQEFESSHIYCQSGYWLLLRFQFSFSQYVYHLLQQNFWIGNIFSGNIYNSSQLVWSKGFWVFISWDDTISIKTRINKMSRRKDNILTHRWHTEEK